MDEQTKKEIWKLFSIASFLFITVFFILPYLVQVSTYFHEKAHQKMLDKYDVESSYHVNLLETIPNFINPRVEKLGVTQFDIGEYKELNKWQRADVNIAGVVSDLRFLFLIAIFLSMTNVYVFYKLRIKKEFNINLQLALNWILFMWLLALIQITVANLTYPSGDYYMLIKFLRV